MDATLITTLLASGISTITTLLVLFINFSREDNKNKEEKSSIPIVSVINDVDELKDLIKGRLNRYFPLADYTYKKEQCLFFWIRNTSKYDMSKMYVKFESNGEKCREVSVGISANNKDIIIPIDISNTGEIITCTITYETSAHVKSEYIVTINKDLKTCKRTDLLRYRWWIFKKEQNFNENLDLNYNFEKYIEKNPLV